MYPKTHFHFFKVFRLIDYYFYLDAEDGETYLAGMIVFIILLIVSFMIIAYSFYRIRRLKLSKENPKNIDRKKSKDISENPDQVMEDANNKQVEDEQSTYTVLNRTGKEDDEHLYTHLTMNQLQHDDMNHKEAENE